MPPWEWFLQPPFEMKLYRSHNHYALLLFVENGFSAIVLVALRVQTVALSADAEIDRPGFKNNHRAKHVRMASASLLGLKNCHHLSNIALAKRIIDVCLTAKLTTNILKGIEKKDIYLHLHVTAALLEASRQFLEWKLSSTKISLQQSLEQNSVSAGCCLLYVIWDLVPETAFRFAIGTVKISLSL